MRCLALIALLLAGSLGGIHASAKTAALTPVTPAGSQLSWILDSLNAGGSAFTPLSLSAHFSPEFLAALPVNQLLNLLSGYVEPVAPLRVARFAGPTDRDELHVVLTTSRSDWSVTIGVEPSGGRRISALFFEPVVTPSPLQPVKGWSDLLSRFKKLAPETSFTAAEITANGCVPIKTLNPDAELGIGSLFKLYVAGELARQIAIGKLSWDQLLTVRDDLRSLPNGDMRLEPAGAQFPIRHFFEQMISQSDNTATDHLIDLLGRANIEAMMVTMGHADPSLNTPLLLTREWFAIKLRWTQQQISSYHASPPTAKRALLESRADADADADTLGQDEEWLAPYLINSIEWFASSADLCRAMAHLHGEAQKPGLGEIQDALSIYSGIDFDATTWKYVGFKGGYETGVKSDTWLLQRTDGRWFVISGIINDPTKEIDGVAMHQLIVAAVNLLAKS